MAKIIIQATFSVDGQPIDGSIEGWAISKEDSPELDQVAFMGPNGEQVGGYNIFDATSSANFYGTPIEEGLVKALWGAAMSENNLALLEWEFYRAHPAQAMRLAN